MYDSIHDLFDELARNKKSKNKHCLVLLHDTNIIPGVPFELFVSFNRDSLKELGIHEWKGVRGVVSNLYYVKITDSKRNKELKYAVSLTFIADPSNRISDDFIRQCIDSAYRSGKHYIHEDLLFMYICYKRFVLNEQLSAWQSDFLVAHSRAFVGVI
jgi:hypothetical protein